MSAPSRRDNVIDMSGHRARLEAVNAAAEAAAIRDYYRGSSRPAPARATLDEIMGLLPHGGRS